MGNPSGVLNMEMMHWMDVLLSPVSHLQSHLLVFLKTALSIMGS